MDLSWTSCPGGERNLLEESTLNHVPYLYEQ